MIAALLLHLALAQATPPAPATPVVSPAPPQDWAGLPVFPLPRTATANDGSAFVHGEVAAGRCVAPPAQPAQPAPPDAARVIAPVAILVAPGGTVSRIVPRAIGCPTVEQFTVGYLLSRTRTVSAGTMPLAPGWYRLTVSYRW